MNSLPAMLRRSGEMFAHRPAILHKQPDKSLRHDTYAQLRVWVDEAAAGLLEAGVAVGERVVILSENRPEWSLADFGILTCGAVTVPLYPSLPAAQVQPLIERVRAAVVIVEDHRQLAKLDALREQLPQIQRIFVFDMAKVPPDHPLARPWSELVERGRSRLPELQAELDARVAALTRDDLATIIFTSGTTGVPKGAMLTHGNFLTNVEAAIRRITFSEVDRLLVILPLSHVFMRMVLYLGMHGGAACLFNESLKQLLHDMLALRPTVMIVVPRMAELLKDRVMAGVQSKQGLSGTIAQWAIGVGAQLAEAYDRGRRPGPWLRLQQRFAEQRVFSAIREQLGLDQMRFMVSGGAALPITIGKWYYGVGLRLVQGYGLTETSPVIAVNGSEGPYRFDCIGAPIEGIEVTIAPDGELWSRGPHIMAGYFEMPEETAQAVDADGWFHTGDLAEQTPEGYLKIVGRKKEIMVLANGKNVAPVPIEARLQESPLLDRVMTIADEQDVVTALIVPNYDALYQAAEAAGVAPPRDAENAWVNVPEVGKLIQAEIDRLSEVLASFERVRRFRLLPRDLSLEQEEITPTLKLRRKQVLANWSDLVKAMVQ